MQRYLAVLVALVAFVAAQTSFQASFSAYNDPLVLGIMTGIVNYDSVAQKLRFDYSVGGGTVSQFFDFTAKLEYLYCTSCDAQTYTSPVPTFYQSQGATLSGNTAIINGVSTSEYLINDINNPVYSVWISGSTTYRAIYKPQPGQTVGKTIDFTGQSAVNSALFTISSWACPAQQCNKMIDFMLIFDESGSITAPNFVLERNFGSSIAAGYVFGPQNIGMGLVQFSGDARLSISMQFVQQNFLNSMAAVYQRGGSTCIGCGIQAAQTEIAAHGRGVSTVFILLTDGMNNVGVSTFPGILAAAKASGVIFFAIGVGPLVDAAEINNIASTIIGATTSFPSIPNWTALGGILNNLIVSTCINIPGTPCGAQCQGFCSCKGVCQCPSVCNDNNECTVDACNPGINGAGCTYTPKTCNDGNYCTVDNCIPTKIGGCDFSTPVNCPNMNACTNTTCVPATGCSYPPVDCDDNNVCTADGCNVNTGCTHTPISCDMCLHPVVVVCPTINCYTNQCNVTNGLCSATPIDCNDNNACTDDSCDAGTGLCVHIRKTCNDNNACTYDYCDTTTGCYNPPYNVSVVCNDYNACTNDTCNPLTGCMNTNITCSDGDPCTVDLCNSFTGCYFPPFDCLSIPRIAKLLGNCYNALCSKAQKGCYLDQLPGTAVDSCGVCNGNNACVVVPLPSNVPYVIGGALLAVIIIASIIICAALSAFGGKKGYDIWLAHRNNMSGASTNPLYNDNGLSGNNPMYSGNA